MVVLSFSTNRVGAKKVGGLRDCLWVIVHELRIVLTIAWRVATLFLPVDKIAYL